MEFLKDVVKMKLDSALRRVVLDDGSVWVRDISMPEWIREEDYYRVNS